MCVSRNVLSSFVCSWTERILHAHILEATESLDIKRAKYIYDKKSYICTPIAKELKLTYGM